MTTAHRDPHSPAGGRLLTSLRLLVDVRGPELSSLLLSFVYFFFAMSAWFVLRPIRDEIAAASGVRNLPWLFLGTLGATLLFNPIYGALVVRFRVRKFIALTYHIFVANLFVFYLLMRLSGSAEGSTFELWMGRSFYVWTSVFNFFVISIFWSFMADAFTSDQAKRLFGFIGVGGTLGSITGSAFTAAMASTIGTQNLLLVSALLLEIAVLVVMWFPRRAVGPTPPEAGAPAHDNDIRIGGSAWGGLTRLLQSPYLLAIAVFLTLYILGSTVLYASQTDLVGRLYPTRGARTTVLAQLELAAQVLTLFTQFFFTGRITKWFGLTVTLAVVPVLTMLGFGALGLFPAFQTLAVLMVCRRAANFSLMNPAMETLFTVVSREDKYKAKNFIETFVYRFSDQLTVWAYAGLAALGLGLSGIAFVVVPVAGLSVALALWLGRRQKEMDRAGA
ncbi:MAG: MFS transporter [Candidatus Eisenbacteria bacterium]|nr:MFS transporter [Candidatus Eisenbacteria bacterium]